MDKIPLVAYLLTLVDCVRGSWRTQSDVSSAVVLTLLNCPSDCPTTKDPFIATQLNSARRRVELSCVARHPHLTDATQLSPTIGDATDPVEQRMQPISAKQVSRVELCRYKRASSLVAGHGLVPIHKMTTFHVYKLEESCTLKHCSDFLLRYSAILTTSVDPGDRLDVPRDTSPHNSTFICASSRSTQLLRTIAWHYDMSRLSHSYLTNEIPGLSLTTIEIFPRPISDATTTTNKITNNTVVNLDE